jgi:hypothetical protein
MAGFGVITEVKPGFKPAADFAETLLPIASSSTDLATNRHLRCDEDCDIELADQSFSRTQCLRRGSRDEHRRDSHDTNGQDNAMIGSWITHYPEADL